MPDKDKKLDVALFEQKELRRLWLKGEWYYSITDVIAILTDSPILGYAQEQSEGRRRL